MTDHIIQMRRKNSNEWEKLYPVTTSESVKHDDGSLNDYLKNIEYVTPEFFGAKGDGVNDDSQYIQEAINTNEVVFLGSKTYVINETLMLNDKTKIIGSGMFNTVIQTNGEITALDLSNENAKQGVLLSDFAIYGVENSGNPLSIGIDLKYFVNGSALRNIRIERMYDGIRIEKSWYSSFDNLFIRACERYGLHGITDSSTAQLNAISFRSLFIQQCKTAVYLEGNWVSTTLLFDSCTFEKSRKTGVITELVSPITFLNCYFESNYTDGATSDTLQWNTPIDLKMTVRNPRTVLNMDGCYFSRRNNFKTSDQKTSIYIGANATFNIKNTMFQCNESNYMNANVFLDDTATIFYENNKQDGYAKDFYVGKEQKEYVYFSTGFNLRYSSNVDDIFIAQNSGDYYISYKPSSTKTIESHNIRFTNGLTDELLRDVNFGQHVTQGEIIEKRINIFDEVDIVKMFLTIPTTSDALGEITIYRKYV